MEAGTKLRAEAGRITILSRTQWMNTTVAEFETRLLRYARRFVPEAVAREIVQETFLRLWQQSESEIAGRLAEWLFAVCRNQAVDWTRRQSRHVAGTGDIEIVADMNSAGPDEQLSRSQETGRMLRYLALLPFEQQEVLRLKFQEDLSYKQISSITGHSVSYVGVLIHTGITEMRRRMGQKTEKKP